jgi:hypothetical protein
MDSTLLLCEAQSIATTAGAAATVSTNVIDLGAHIDHKGNSIDSRTNTTGALALNIVVEDEAILAVTNGAVVTFRLFDDTDTLPTTGGRQILEFAITATTTPAHPDGTQICSLPLPAIALSRYLGMATSVTTQDLSTGKVTAWIGPVTQQS